MVNFPAEWIELIGLFVTHHVRFLVVGAHAVAAHGRPRATLDLDLWVEPTRANATQVCAALTDFGFTELGKAVDEFATPQRMVALGRQPLRIHIMTSIDGVSFDVAWEGSVTARLGGYDLRFLGKEQLIQNKRAAGRPKDLLDIALLEEGQD